MGDKESSLAIRTEDLDTPSQFEFVAAPKDYFLGPVFAARKQAGPREITINQRRYQVGGFHPLKPNERPPALDVRHARAIFALLTFRDQDTNSPEIRFSFNEFCRKYAHTNGGRYARDILGILGDLMDAYIRVTDISTQISHEYRLIERVDIITRPPRRRDARLAKSPQKELWFNGCTLSPEFYGILNRIAELQHLNFDVFRSIRSPLAQAVYLYIPSRAHHHTENDPFEITLTKLLEQVSVDVPAQKNRRRQIFTQNSRSIIKQLNGVATLTGIFHVRLAETADGSDWKLLAWVEKAHGNRKRDPRSSKLMTAFLAGGHSQQELDRRLTSVQELSGYERELLTTATVEVEKNARFFEMAKALLGTTRFIAIAAEAKGDALEGRKATKNPTARIIWRMMEAVSEKSHPSGAMGLETGRDLRRLISGSRRS
jgi:hypothetical protein